LIILCIMEEIRDIVSSVIQDISSKKIHNHPRIKDILQENFKNKKTFQHIHIFGFKEGTLVVHVDTPAWLFQCNLQKGKILKELQKEIAEIKKIYFKIGKVK